MKRIHLFEFEDLSWFPDWIRILMTRYLMTFHRILGTPDQLVPLVKKGLAYSEKQVILDLCSGSGGPMIEVFDKIKGSGKFPRLKMVLSDLYPNQFTAEALNESDPDITYHTEPLDATRVPANVKALRTMVSSMHHMTPDLARKILGDARQPILIFELSDNSLPAFLWWLAIPVAIIITLFVTPMVRPMTLQQLVFTYLIPILPIFIAWDGAVSNARTYTLEDINELLEGLSGVDYKWEKGVVKGKGGNKLYLLGMPQPTEP